MLSWFDYVSNSSRIKSLSIFCIFIRCSYVASNENDSAKNISSITYLYDEYAGGLVTLVERLVGSISLAIGCGLTGRRYAHCCPILRLFARHASLASSKSILTSYLGGMFTNVLRVYC